MPRDRSRSGVRARTVLGNDMLDFAPVKATDQEQQLKDNEASPLLRPTSSGFLETGRPPPLSLQAGADDNAFDDEQWRPSTSQDTKGISYMFLLTICMAGLQMGWSVEMAYGSPFLLGLGITKAMLGLVWIAGPLSGVLVQPYVGSKSDRCRSKWGKRRPFIAGGGLATAISLLALAWTRELVAAFFSVFGIDSLAPVVKTTSIIFAVIMVYVLDFAINVFQAAIRAFIVDCAPVHQQSQANAWASRVSGFANIFGFMFGFTNLPAIFPWLGNTQFKVLCVITVLAIAVTGTISCLSVKERDPRPDGPPPKQNSGAIAFCTDLYRSAGRLPLQVRRVCQVQFLAWIGWFPFLFYTSTFIGNLYVDPFLRAEPNMPKERLEELNAKGTRIATFALMMWAIVTVCGSVLLPLTIQRTFRPRERAAPTPMTPVSVGTGAYFNHHLALQRSALTRTVTWINLHIPSIRIPGLTLRRMFVISHVLFAFIIWTASFAQTARFASIMVACVGVPWAVTYWAPFALIAAEVSKRDAIRRGQIEAPPTEDGQLLARGEDPAEGADQAGIVLGIHNVCIAAPQVIATLVSSVIFKFLQKPPGVPGDNSLAWVYRLGGIFALAAAYWATKIEEDDIVVNDVKFLGHGGH